MLTRPRWRKAPLVVKARNDACAPATTAGDAVGPGSLGLGGVQPGRVEDSGCPIDTRRKGCDEIDETVERFGGRRRALDRGAQLWQALLLVDVGDEGEEKLRLRSEMDIDRLPRYAGRGSDRLQANAVVTAFLEQPACGLEDASTSLSSTR